MKKFQRSFGRVLITLGLLAFASLPNFATAQEVWVVDRTAPDDWVPWAWGSDQDTQAQTGTRVGKSFLVPTNGLYIIKRARAIISLKPTDTSVDPNSIDLTGSTLRATIQSASQLPTGGWGDARALTCGYSGPCAYSDLPVFTKLWSGKKSVVYRTEIPVTKWRRVLVPGSEYCVSVYGNQITARFGVSILEWKGPRPADETPDIGQVFGVASSSIFKLGDMNSGVKATASAQTCIGVQIEPIHLTLAVVNGAVRLTWNEGLAECAIERCPSLADGTWTLVPDSGTTDRAYIDLPLTEKGELYRLRPL